MGQSLFSLLLVLMFINRQCFVTSMSRENFKLINSHPYLNYLSSPILDSKTFTLYEARQSTLPSPASPPFFPPSRRLRAPFIPGFPHRQRVGTRLYPRRLEACVAHINNMWSLIISMEWLHCISSYFVGRWKGLMTTFSTITSLFTRISAQSSKKAISFNSSCLIMGWHSLLMPAGLTLTDPRHHTSSSRKDGTESKVLSTLATWYHNEPLESMRSYAGVSLYPEEVAGYALAGESTPLAH
ncbi:hypothetical protein BU16DRAFT_157969 [Lophium mytilinum]|uniref:Uncharacterized protein n=1 Tax=Lophium mytilinum TaxID=390894 RepID=A0A6A6QG01_9PEZI|nr:hypothetical protein BU16DRAFT_157969 [Lophium mytilinum]